MEVRIFIKVDSQSPYFIDQLLLKNNHVLSNLIFDNDDPVEIKKDLFSASASKPLTLVILIHTKSDWLRGWFIKFQLISVEDR